jgi:hypothetical protein
MIYLNRGILGWWSPSSAKSDGDISNEGNLVPQSFVVVGGNQMLIGGLWYLRYNILTVLIFLLALLHDISRAILGDLGCIM